MITPFATAEVISNNEHGFVIENKGTVAASQQQVWQWFVEDVDKWWPKDHTQGKQSTLNIDAAGGCFYETTAPEIGNSAEHMRVSVEKHKTLRMIGGLGPLQSMAAAAALDWQFSTNEQQQTQVCCATKQMVTHLKITKTLFRCR